MLNLLAEPIVPAISIAIAPAKMFTYPTGLASCWPTSIQEIHLPGYQVTKPEVKLTLLEGSTRLFEGRERNPLRMLRKKIAAPIRVDDGSVFDARGGDGNMAHILECAAPSILAAQKSCSKVTVVLGTKAAAMGRDAFGLLGSSVIYTDAEVIGKLIVVKETHARWISGDGMYAITCGDISFDGYKKNTPERIFISRKKTRVLINEAEVEQTLNDYGFKKVYFEDIPVAEQWSLARNAKAIVGIHGAALISLVFNRNAAKVVELFHPGYVVNWYRHIINAVGGTWVGVTGQLPSDIIRRLEVKRESLYYQMESIRIDIASLKLALKAIDLR